MEISSGKPYYDKAIGDGRFVRTFQADVYSDELIWHRDKKDRIIKVLAGDNWKLQFDNEIPFDIKIDDEIQIPKMVYHRLIKGTSVLKLMIEEIG